MAQERKLAAIMFTDIVGYTSLMEEDEKRAFQLLEKNRKIHKPIIKKYRGKWLKEMGDGILASFSTISNAVYCAIEIQEVCKNETDLNLRIGIHQGEVIFEGSDVFGSGVNIASRLEELAPIGGIYVSESVSRNIENKTGFNTEFVKEEILKNVKHPIRVYQISVEGDVFKINGKDEKGIKVKKPYKIISGIIMLVFAVILLWFKFPASKSNATNPVVDKSIAVLPFKNESTDEENKYFVDGMMEEILNNLSKISELRIPTRTSTEKYRDTNRSTKEIANELEVRYLLVAAVQKQGYQIKIHAKLIDAESDSYIWSESYDANLAELGSMFKVQSRIAKSIAEELYLTIKPAEQRIIEDIPTLNLSAYDFYLRARDEHAKYWFSYMETDALENAISLYKRALEYDSTYAKGYTGLALAYIDKHESKTFLEENYLDTVLALANIAHSYDEYLDEIYFVKGTYYLLGQGNYVEALHNYQKTVQINPNNASAFRQIGEIYIWNFDDYVRGLKNLHKAVSLDKSRELIKNLKSLGAAYSWIGFEEEALYYMNEAFKLDNDTIDYYLKLGGCNYSLGKFQTAINYYKLAFSLDSLNWGANRNLIEGYSTLDQPELAYKHLCVSRELQKRRYLHRINYFHREAYVLWQVGKKEEALELFNEQIKYCLESVRLKRIYAVNGAAYYDLAAVYSFLNEYDKAFDALKKFKQIKKLISLAWINYFRYDSLFDNIREDDRFKEFLKYAESTYSQEHEKVKKWLEENPNLAI